MGISDAAPAKPNTHIMNALLTRCRRHLDLCQRSLEEYIHERVLEREIKCVSWCQLFLFYSSCCWWCCHIKYHIQVRGHRTGFSHSGAEEYAREKTQTNQRTRWYTHISQLMQMMPPPETCKKWNREPAYGVPGPYWCMRVITRAWKSRLYRLPTKKDYHVYIARSTYHHAYARQTQVNWKKETRIRK